MRGKDDAGGDADVYLYPECGDQLLLWTAGDISEGDLPHAGADPRETAPQRAESCIH